MDQIRQAERDAFLARATVVALDPSGIHPFGPGLDQQAPTRLGDFGSSSPSPPADDFRSDIASSSFPAPSSDHLGSGGDAFAVLARDTSGSRLSTSNQPEKLLAAETELLSSRYRIGFTPDAATSQTRSVAVAVTRAGLRVRTATGQRSLSGETMVRSRFASALLSRDLPQADIPIRVEANKPPKGWFGTKTLSFEVLLPAREVFVEDRGKLSTEVSRFSSPPQTIKAASATSGARPSRSALSGATPAAFPTPISRFRFLSTSRARGSFSSAFGTPRRTV